MPNEILSVDRLVLGNCLYLERASGYAYHRAYHPDLWELDIVQQGLVRVQFERSRVYLGKNQGLLIAPGMIHQPVTEGTQPYLGLVAHFQTNCAELHRLAGQTLALSSQALALVRQFMDVWGDNAVAELRRKAALALLLLELMYPQGEPDWESPTLQALGRSFGHRLADRVLEAMRHELAHDINVTRLAQVAGYSVGQLRNLFRRQTGMTLRHAQALVRLEEAKRLLLRSPYKIAEVGKMVGIRSPNKFSAFFRRHVGCTPREFIRNRAIASERTLRGTPPRAPGGEVAVAEDASARASPDARPQGWNKVF